MGRRIRGRTVQVRMNREELAVLDALAVALDASRSEVLRHGLRQVRALLDGLEADGLVHGPGSGSRRPEPRGARR